jgi:hypothetical protein
MGKLPSTKDECATLAAIQLRIYELAYYAEFKDKENEDPLEDEFKLEIEPIRKHSQSTNKYNNNNNNEAPKNNVLKRDESTFAQLNNILFSSRKESAFYSEYLIDSANIPINRFILTNGCLESFYFYFRSCGCINSDSKSRILSVKHLVAPNYLHATDIIKLIKVREINKKRDFYIFKINFVLNLKR